MGQSVRSETLSGAELATKIVRCDIRPTEVVVDRTDPSFWSKGALVSTPPEDVGQAKTKPAEKRKLGLHQICPVCEFEAVNIRCKLVCTNCRTIVQSCCD
jgi:hypothetical protein